MKVIWLYGLLVVLLTCIHTYISFDVAIPVFTYFLLFLDIMMSVAPQSDLHVFRYYGGFVGPHKDLLTYVMNSWVNFLIVCSHTLHMVHIKPVKWARLAHSAHLAWPNRWIRPVYYFFLSIRCTNGGYL